MKNSYRIYPVYGTSALKYEASSERNYSNIVELPISMRCEQHHRNNLRIHRETAKPNLKTKVDITLSFIVCYAFCLGVVLSMI